MANKVTRGSKILTDRIKELMKGEDGSSGLLSVNTSGLHSLENMATQLDLLPIVFYKEDSDEPETGDLDEYLYGKEIPAQEYLIAVFNHNMREQKISQVELCKRTKIAQSSISLILNNNRRPHLRTIEVLSSELKLSPAYLVPKREGNPPPRIYHDSFERVTETLRGYLHSILAGDEVPLSDLHQVVEYSGRINELTAALRVKYDALKDQGEKNNDS